MKILYVGAGYVGACSAAVSADSGHNVLVYDIDKTKISNFSSLEKEKIEFSLYEEGLADLIIKNKSRLSFTDDINVVKEQLDEVSAIFMCLPTPEMKETGKTDLSYYNKAVEDLAGVMKERNNGEQSKYILIVNKSTVPLGMTNQSQEILNKVGVKNYGVGSNPEFLVEGKAIEGSISPDRVVVGAWEEKDFEIFRDVYKRFYDSPKTTYIEANPREAEAGKLLANFTLFNKLAVCYDVIGRVCEKFDNLHFENVRKILTSDNRIGSWGLYDSLFAGGSCFIKDARSLSYQLKEEGAVTDIVDDVLEANNRQLDLFIRRPEKELDFKWEGKSVALMGVAFKRDTNDIRNSGSIGIAKYLLEKNVDKISIYDPVACDNFINYFQNDKIEISKDRKETFESADVLIVATDWPEFRELDHTIIKYLKKGALVMDGRRMLQHKFKEICDAGYSIIAVGSPLIKAK